MSVQELKHSNLPLRSQKLLEEVERKHFNHRLAKIQSPFWTFEGMVRRRFHLAGIEVNGPRPYDIQIHNRAAYKAIALNGTLGLGESYMDGQWSNEVFSRQPKISFRI